MSECPGCGKEMKHPSGDPMRTLWMIDAHDLFCAPPGVFDILIYLDGGPPSPSLGMWVGRSIEAMVRSLA